MAAVALIAIQHADPDGRPYLIRKGAAIPSWVDADLRQHWLDSGAAGTSSSTSVADQIVMTVDLTVE